MNITNYNMKIIFKKFNINEIDNIRLEDIYSLYEVYPTYKKAKCRNFEAHHIIPIKIQMKNKGFLGNKVDFIKSELLDDRCLRLSSFEHILIHYIMARDLGGDYISVFENMERYNLLRLHKEEVKLLEYLKSWESLIEIGKIKRRESLKGNHSGSYNKKYYNNGKINILLLETDEVPEGFVKGRLKRIISEEERSIRSEKVKGNNNPSYGKKWYTNGIETIYLNPKIDKIPEGFYLGNSYNSYKRSESQRLNMSNIHNSVYGKICFNNGERNIFLFPGEEVPEGFVKGRFFKESDKNKIKALRDSYIKDRKNNSFKGSWNDYQKERCKKCQ